MKNPSDKILLAHGSGGVQSRELIRNVFAHHFSNPALDVLGDSAIVDIPQSQVALTTDSYVVKPLFFPGGDIGKLAVCGTINDLAVAGARPLFITTGFIIEEGTAIGELEKIVSSMADAARSAGVDIVAGDTKVVERGNGEGMFITTSGLGQIITPEPIAPSRIDPGDAILINGPIADHGMAIMTAREGLAIETPIESDCAALNSLTERLITAVPETRFMRDATRGGLAAVLCEACENQSFGIEVEERAIPLREATLAACEILGIDPLHVANEGKLVAFVPGEAAQAALDTLKDHPLGRQATIIGQATKENARRVNLVTTLGTSRQILMPSGDLLPRIC